MSGLMSLVPPNLAIPYGGPTMGGPGAAPDPSELRRQAREMATALAAQGNRSGLAEMAQSGDLFQRNAAAMELDRLGVPFSEIVNGDIQAPAEQIVPGLPRQDRFDEPDYPGSEGRLADIFQPPPTDWSAAPAELPPEEMSAVERRIAARNAEPNTPQWVQDIGATLSGAFQGGTTGQGGRSLEAQENLERDRAFQARLDGPGGDYDYAPGFGPSPDADYPPGYFEMMPASEMPVLPAAGEGDSMNPNTADDAPVSAAPSRARASPERSGSGGRIGMGTPPTPPRRPDRSAPLSIDNPAAAAMTVSDAAAEDGAPSWALPLIAMGLQMAASNNPSFFGAMAEGGVSAMQMLMEDRQREIEEARYEAEQARADREFDADQDYRSEVLRLREEEQNWGREMDMARASRPSGGGSSQPSSGGDPRGGLTPNQYMDAVMDMADQIRESQAYEGNMTEQEIMAEAEARVRWLMQGVQGPPEGYAAPNLDSF